TLLAEWLDHALRRVASRGETVAVFYLDLDRFKGINDGLGHEAGDAVLVETARRLTACLPAAGTLARGRGGEVRAARGGVPAHETQAIANRLLATLREPVAVGSSEVFLDASLGLVVSGPDFATVGDLLRAADIAAYQAKRQGRGIVVAFEPGMSVRPPAW